MLLSHTFPIFYHLVYIHGPTETSCRTNLGIWFCTRLGKMLSRCVEPPRPAKTSEKPKKNKSGAVQQLQYPRPIKDHSGKWPIIDDFSFQGTFGTAGSGTSSGFGGASFTLCTASTASTERNFKAGATRSANFISCRAGKVGQEPVPLNPKLGGICDIYIYIICKTKCIHHLFDISPLHLPDVYIW